jgi:hypothetical protein
VLINIVGLALALKRKGEILLGQRSIRVLVVIGYLLVTVGLPLYTPPKVKAATISFRNAATATNNAATSLTINKPTGTTAGDVLILIIALDAQNQTGFTVGAGNDWTQIRHSNNGTGVTVDSYYKIAGNSEPSNYSVSWAGSTRAAGSISAYSGVDLMTPIEVIGTTSTANGNSITVSGITTLTNNSVVVGVFGGSDTSGVAFSTPTGMTSRTSLNTTTGTSDVTAATFDQTIATAGATGTRASTTGGGIPKAGHLFAMRPAIDVPTLMMFWDGTDISGNPLSLPSGWSFVDTYNGRYPRGDAVGNFGLIGGNATHTITVTGVTVSGPIGAGINNGIGSQVSTTSHTHPLNAFPSVVAPVSNEPAYRSYRLIRYNNGIPPFIPGGAVAFFDDTGLPATGGWTQQTTYNNRMLKVDSSAGTGGSNTHVHDLDWSSSNLTGSSSATTGRQNLITTGGTAITNDHVHAAPSGANAPDTAPIEALPPYIEVILAKANSDTIAIPAGMHGMFDRTPGSGWVVKTNTSSDKFYQRFVQADSTYNDNAALGSLTHNHSPVVATTATASGGTTFANWNAASNVISNNHTHNLTASFSTNNDNVPLYFNVVIAEKINFILSDYRWYEDTDAEDVTDPWGRSDVAQNTIISTVPARNDPPMPTQELRLRVRVTVSGQDLTANDIGFKLEYKQGTDATCTTGSWSNVGAGGSGSVWRFASSSVADGTQLTTSRLTPTSSVLEMYVKSNSAMVNPNGATIGQTLEYDFHLEHNGALDGTMYSFRMIEGGGALLAEYNKCPTLVTRAGTGQLMRHGNVFESETERGFTWAD